MVEKWRCLSLGMPRLIQVNFFFGSFTLFFEHPFCKDLSRNFSNVSARTGQLLAPSFSSSTSFEKAAKAPAQAKMKFPNEHTQEVKKWVIERIENM